MTEWAAKRFWSDVKVDATEGGFAIKLDGRAVKTPAKAGLIVPSSALAEAIAEEWRAQDDKIDPGTMPMTRSANSAIDKVRVQRAEVAALVAEYGGSDLLCYRAAYPQKLVDRQRQEWDPLLDWGEAALGARLVLTEGVMHVSQPAEAVDILTRQVAAQGPFSLTALYDLVALSGSLIIGFAAQQSAFELDQLWRASCLDESFQAEEWGADEEAQETLEIKAAAFKNAAKFQQLVGMHSYTM